MPTPEHLLGRGPGRKAPEVVGPALRLAIDRAMGSDLTRRQLLVFLEVVKQTAGWTKVEDTTFLAKIAAAVYRVERAERWHCRKVAEDLRVLEAVGVIERTVPKGRPPDPADRPAPNYRVALPTPERDPGAGVHYEPDDQETDPEDGDHSDGNEPRPWPEMNPGAGPEMNPGAGPPTEGTTEGKAEGAAEPVDLVDLAVSKLAPERRSEKLTAELADTVAELTAAFGAVGARARLNAIDAGHLWPSKIARAARKAAVTVPSPSALDEALARAAHYAQAPSDSKRFDLEQIDDPEVARQAVARYDELTRAAA